MIRRSLPIRASAIAAALLAATGLADAQSTPAPADGPAAQKPAAPLRLQLPRPRPKPPLLGPSAFRAPSKCSLDPFAERGSDQRLRQLDAPGTACGGEELLAFSVAAPPPSRPAAAQARRLDVSVDQWTSARLDDRLSTSARLGWTATGDARLGWQTQRALVAAGGLLRLSDHWAMELQLGRDRQPFALRSRASWSTLWRFAGEHLLYMQVAEEPAGVAPTVGMRWWLAPKRASLELSAYRPVGTQRVLPRLGLSLPLGR